MRFTMEIWLGNAGMRTSDDLAEALRKLAKRLEDNTYVEACSDTGDIVIRDILDKNGNDVGVWHIFEGDEPNSGLDYAGSVGG